VLRLEVFRGRGWAEKQGKEHITAKRDGKAVDVRGERTEENTNKQRSGGRQAWPLSRETRGTEDIYVRHGKANG